MLTCNRALNKRFQWYCCFSLFKQKKARNEYQVCKYAKKKDRVPKKKVITDTCNVDARKAANTARDSLKKEGGICAPPPLGKNRPKGEN